MGFFHLNLMWILGGVIGVFLALDLFMFFFFWEMMLVPMYFLIALWGHSSSDGKKTRIYAATKFFIFTQASGLIMLVAILGLVLVNFNNTGVITFNYADLLKVQMSKTTEYVLMLGFFIAFAVKLPVVPFHSWLPDAHAQAPTAGSVDLAGILLKTAAYGLLRFALPLFPNASAEFAPIAMTLGLIGIFYGAFLAFAQTDIKRLIAFSSVSHMGFVLIGIYSGSQLALQGAVIQMLAHGLSAAALFILSGQLYERLHTRDMREMGGIWSRIAYLPAISLFFAAASLGLPGTRQLRRRVPDPDRHVRQRSVDHRHRHLRPGVRFGLLADHDPPCLLRPDQVGRSAARHGRSRTDHGARPCGAAGLPRRFPATVPRHICRHDAWRAAVARHRLLSTRFGPVRALWNSRFNTLSRLRRC